jgi:hypothetical protein
MELLKIHTQRDYRLADRPIAETKQHCPSVLKFTNQQSAAAQSMLEALAPSTNVTPAVSHEISQVPTRSFCT